MQIEFRLLKELFMYFSKQLSYLDGVNFRLTEGEFCVKVGANRNIIRASARPHYRGIAFCISFCYK